MLDEVRLKRNATQIRHLILDMCRGKVGGHHLGGSLSTVEILAYIYGYLVDIEKINIKDDSRDRFILSKGHGVLSYYSTLYFSGLMSEETFLSYKKFGSEIIAHPIMNLDNGIESSNGSLGHGLSFASGMAQGLKLQNLQSTNVVVLVGDGECNEGSVWEAAMSSASLGLDNLTLIVDCNGFQSDGETKDIIHQSNLPDRFSAFGFNTIEIDGHNFSDIHKAFSSVNSNQPKAIIAKTIKGKGIPYMENNNDWHHSTLTEKSYQEAIETLR